MSVYVDALVDYRARLDWPAWRRKQWCHLLADSEPELRAFACRLGLNEAWIQYPGDPARVHFDVQPRFRARALSLGAIEVTARELVALRRAFTSTESSSYG